MNGCQSCSFYSRRAWNIFHYFQSWKVKVNLETRYLATPQHPKNRWDICKTFFSDFGCNFLLLGGVFHKCSKSKYHSIHQGNFLPSILSVKKHPITDFCFFPSLHATIFWTCSFSDLKVPCKNFHVLGENWQRNHFPKLTTLWLLFHTCHNFPIVQCLPCHTFTLDTNIGNFLCGFFVFNK